jgi:hypothetical protein
LPARSHSSARPEIRTAPTHSASAETAPRTVTLGHQSALPWTNGLPAAGATHAEASLAPNLCVSCLRQPGTARDTPLHSVVCDPCWAAGDGDISTVELDKSTGVESELPRTAIEWFRALLGSEWYQQRRRDAASRLRGLLKELALRADWEDHSTWPTWERLQAASGWRRSSTAAALAELQRRGWLVRLERGTTPRFRPMALQHVEGNRAAVYQLRIPTAEAESRNLPTSSSEPTSPTTWTPTHSPNQDLKTSPVVPTRAITSINNPQVSAPNRANDGPTGPSHEKKDLGYFAARVPVTRAEMLAAGLELQSADRALHRLSPRWIRSLMKRWWHAGWTNQDLLYALHHRPAATGKPEPVLACPANQLRRPDGWVRHRLSAWHDERGPLVAPSVDASRRSSIGADQGQGAAKRLPYGACELHEEDLYATEQDRSAAAAELVRQWAREFHEHRARPRLDEEVAARDAARDHYDRISATLGIPRTSAQPPEPAPDPRPAPPPSDSADVPSAHERALERARDERRTGMSRPPHTRRHRRFR